MDQVIIFDLDGTLIDSRQDLTTAVNLTRDVYGLPALSMKTVCGYIGNGAQKLLERSLADSDISVEEAMPHMKKFYYANIVNETKLYPGVLEGLKKLKAAGIKMAVITNKPDEAAKMALTELGINEYFDEVMGGGCGHPLKPEPDALLYFAEKWHAELSSSWMVGDHYTDLESGKRAGMMTCWASYGFGETKGLPYDFEAGSFEEFVSAVIGH